MAQRRERERERQELAAALAEVQARQACLSRGTVFHRPVPSSDAHPTLNATMTPPATAATTATAAAARSRPAPLKHTRLQPDMLWVRKPVVRWRDKQQQVVDAVGSVEFVASASLAGVRVLVDQFLALPPRRRYEFVHPTTHARVEPAEENLVFPADFPCVMLVILPVVDKNQSDVAALSPGAVFGRQSPHRSPISARKEKRRSPTAPPRAKPKPAADDSDRRHKEDDIGLFSLQESATLLERENDSDQSARTIAVELRNEMGATEETMRDKDGKDEPCAGLASPRAQFPVGKGGLSIADLTSPQSKTDTLNELDKSSATGKQRQTFRLDVVAHTDELQAVYEKENTAMSTLPAESRDPSVVIENQTLTVAPQDDDASPHGRRASSPGKSPQRTPVALRRARRFKSLSPSKLPESSWEDNQKTLRDSIVVRQAQALIKEIVEIFFNYLKGGLANDGPVIFSSEQLTASFENYGVDCSMLPLNGVLLALNDELSIRCAETPNGIDAQLIKYLLTISPLGDDEVVNADALPRFECALNVFSGMRLWIHPTQLRVACVEEAYPDHFISISDNKRLRLLRLSERDREICTLLYSNCLEAGLEEWLTDGLELVYLLLYAFLQSKRNTGAKAIAKMDFVSSKQERVEAVTRKISSLSLEAWKTLDFRVGEIDDLCMARRAKDLLVPFLSASNQHSSELESCVFFPALVEYLSKKANLLSQSFSGLLADTRHSQSSPRLTTGFLRSLHEHFTRQEGDPSSIEGYLLNAGLKVIDVEKINAARIKAGLGRIYINGRTSIVTHRQCELMATDSNLRLKTRWNRQYLRDDGVCTRYVFHGNRDVALEFVYVSTNRVTAASAELSWEKREAFAKEELYKAFEMLCNAPLEIPSGTWIGTGINMMHADLLPRITSLLPISAILRDYVHATSVSLGYHTGVQGTRVLFRVHSEFNTLGQATPDDYNAEEAQVQSIMEELERFLRRAGEKELVAFCEADGISFLHSRLPKQRGHQWNVLTFGDPFYRHMHSRGVMGRSLDYPRDDILQCINMLVPVVARALRCITEENLRIIVGFAVAHVDDTDTGSIVAATALETLRRMCCGRPGNMATSLHSQFVAIAMTETQKHFSTRGGFKLLVDAVDKVEDLPARKAVIDVSILSLMMTHEISGTEGGLLVHWQDWLTFYVENDAWETCEGKAPFLIFLLHQIHDHFFTADTFVQPTTAVCFCGCNGHLVDAEKACIGVMQMFLRLMLTDAGIMWAQEDMRGPHDCISFLKWSMAPHHETTPGVELQQLILNAVNTFLERMTSPHQYLHFLATLTPRLLKLLNELPSGMLQAAATRMLSLAFRLAVDRKVWTISLETFLDPFYQILETLCEDHEPSVMNVGMVNVLFSQSSGQKVEHSRNYFCSLLHEEHTNFVGRCGELSPASRSRSKSFLQSLASFCSLTWSSVLQPFCQLPMLIVLGWILNSPELAEDLIHLEVDELLLTLIESEHSATSILAIRALTMLMFQGLLARRVFDDHRLRKLCNLLTTALGVGARMALGSQWSEDPDNPQVLLFAASQSDMHTLLRRYNAFNQKKLAYGHDTLCDEDDGPPEKTLLVTSIWEDHEWEDPVRVGPAKLAADLKLLAVFSTLTGSVLSIKHSDEMRQLLGLLVQFLRDRVHVAAHHTLLYLFSLKNLVWALRSDLPRWGISELVETEFLHKLLQYSQSRSSKLHQELASGILWGLADAFEKTNTFALSFEVTDKLSSKENELATTTGLSVLVDNLSYKMTSGNSVESDAGLLASLLVNPSNSAPFIESHGYPFVLKLIEAMLRSPRPDTDNITPPKPNEDPDPFLSPVETFGVEAFYSCPIKKRKDRELLQLCRVAVKTLQAMQHLAPQTLQDEITRTKMTMLPLLNHENDLVVLQAVSCCIAHLQAHPSKCAKLLPPEVQDKVITLLFHDGCPQLQAAAFTCIKLALADQTCFADPIKLQDKIAPLLEQIVQCLRSPHFEVKRRAMVFLVELAFRLEDEPGFITKLADAFATPSNRDILMGLFETLSQDFERNTAAGSVLLLLVRLILKLDLIVHTDGRQLVDAICMMLKTHSNDTFLRPMLCSCLLQIATESGGVEHLARKSKLGIILELLVQNLTMGELRGVAKLLSTLAIKHSGIRRFLSSPGSGCMVKIAKVLRAFSAHLRENSSAENPLLRQDEKPGVDSSYKKEAQQEVRSPTDSARYLLKIDTKKNIYVSHYTEDVYEQFMRLLLLLVRSEGDWLEERSGCSCREKTGCSKCDPCDAVAKARCGHLVLRLSIACRVLSADSSVDRLLSTEGSTCTSVAGASIQALMILATNHQCRLQMLRNTDWTWIECLTKHAECSSADTAPDSVIHTIMLLGHLSAVKEVAEHLLAERQFVTLLFSYMELVSSGSSLTPNVDLRRASSFTLARLAEYPKFVQDSDFQGQMAMLLRPTLDPDDPEEVGGEQDTVTLANKMIIVRNRALLTPGFQGRAADESNVTTLMNLLRAPGNIGTDRGLVEVALIATDVLASILFVNLNTRDKLRKYSMMMRHARVIAPTDEHPGGDKTAISSKQLAGCLRRWLAPMLVEARHQGSSGAYHDDSTRILEDELSFSCSLLGDPTPRGLLYLLLAMLLELPSICTTSLNGNGSEPEREVSDEIPSYEQGLARYERARFLQYVFPATDRLSFETNDHNFRGSAHTWLFLRKLWQLANGTPGQVQEEVEADMREAMIANISLVISRWSSERGTKYSAAAYQRRQCFLEFVAAVMDTDASASDVIEISTLIDLVEDNAADPNLGVGKEFELLYRMCLRSPARIDAMLKHFGLEATIADEGPGLSSDSFRLFWTAVRLQLTPHQVVLPPLLQPTRTPPSVTMLEPSIPSTAGLAFAIGLLKLLSERTPQCVQWFSERHGAILFFDALLLAALAPTLRMQDPLLRMLLSNLLELLHVLAKTEPDKCHSIFAADPRYLRCVIELVHETAREVQIEGMKLLQHLALQPSLFALLYHVETLSQCISVVGPSTISYWETRFSRQQVAPALPPELMVRIAHVIQVPFFTDLTTAELVKLSVGFTPCNATDEGALVLVAGGCHFSTVPGWMIESKSRVPTSFRLIMEQLSLTFTNALSQSTEGGDRLLALSQDAYMRCTSIATRKTISIRLLNLLRRKQNGAAVKMRCTRSRSDLIARLARLLIEDRAEVVRRASFVKHVPVRVTFEQAKHQQLSDLLSLLQACPLLEGVHRDGLANLAFQLGQPLEIPVGCEASISGLPLTLVFDNDVGFEVSSRGSQDVLQGTVLRGGLLGWPAWLSQTSKDMKNSSLLCSKAVILGVTVSLESLKSGLSEADLAVVLGRIDQIYGSGNPQGLLQSATGQSAVTISLKQQRQLQSSAASLLAQLSASQGFLENLLNNDWTVTVVLEVALGALPAQIVSDALQVLVFITTSELFCKRFCAKELKLWRSKGIPEQTDKYFGVVVEFVRRFKPCLWQGHTEILQKFFAIQSNIANNFPKMWRLLEKLWTPAYLRSCYHLLQTTNTDQRRAAEVAAGHLNSAIHHRPDFLLQCSRDLSLHLQVATALVKVNGGDCTNLLRLLVHLCSDGGLREEIWDFVITGSNAFDGVLKLVASGVCYCFELGYPAVLEIYCDFLYLICTSDVLETLDKEFRCLIESRFGILSTLLQRVNAFSGSRQTILRCISSMCDNDPGNCSIAAAIDLRSGDGGSDTSLLAITWSNINQLGILLGQGEATDICLIEATFSCIRVLQSASRQFETFCKKEIATLALTTLSSLTSATEAPSEQRVAAWQSVVVYLCGVLTNANLDPVEVFGGKNVQVLTAGLSHLSNWYADSNENLKLGRLLRDSMGLLALLVSDQLFRDELWTVALSIPDSENQLVRHIFRWIVFRGPDARAIAALALQNSRKMDRLLCVAKTLEATAVAIATVLTKHADIDLVLCLHPDFVRVISHIFHLLSSSDWDEQLASAWLQFLCFAVEQWEGREHSEEMRVREKQWLSHFQVVVLVQICRPANSTSDEIVCYALRLTWLIIYAQMRPTSSDSASEYSRGGVEEHTTLISLANELIRLQPISKRARGNLLGVLADLASTRKIQCWFAEAQQQLLDVVGALLTALVNGGLQMRSETVEIAAACVSPSLFSSLEWSADDSEASPQTESLLDFGVGYEALRFVLHLCESPTCLAILSSSSFFHSKMYQTLFPAAVTLLGERGNSALWMDVQTDCLRLVTILLSSADRRSLRSDNMHSPVIRAYRQAARKERLLLFCVQLLPEAPPGLKNEIVRALTAYIASNVGACEEVVALRERNQGDLMKMLLTIVERGVGDRLQRDSDLWSAALLLFNAIIEFSFANATYAALPHQLQSLSNIRLSLQAHNAVLESDLPQTLFLVLRIVGNCPSGVDSHVIDEAWELVATLLLNESISSRLKLLVEALEILCCTSGAQTSLVQCVARDWDARGQPIVIFLLGIAGAIEWYEPRDEQCNVHRDTVAVLAGQALEDLVTSNLIAERVKNDTEIVETLLVVRGLEHPWCVLQKRLLDSVLRVTGHQDSVLIQRLLYRYDHLVTLEGDHQILLLTLFPTLAEGLGEGFRTWLGSSVLESSDDHWVELLSLVRAVLSQEFYGEDRGSSLDTHRVIAHEALNVLLNVCNPITFKSMSDASPELRIQLDALWITLETSMQTVESGASEIVSLLPQLNPDDGTTLDQGVKLPVPTQLQVLKLANLIKLAPLIEMKPNIGDQLAEVCFSLWMSQAALRASNCIHNRNTRVLSQVVFHVVASNEQNELLPGVQGFQPFWRVLIRMLATTEHEPLRRDILEMVLHLLQSHSGTPFLEFVQTSMNFDLVDALWWECRTNPKKVEKGSDTLRALWCSLLTQLCETRLVAVRIMELQFLEDFVALQHQLSSDDTLELSGNAALFVLLTTVFRVTDDTDHAQFFRAGHPLTSNTLAELCVRTVTAITGPSATKQRAMEILQLVALNRESLESIRKACNLDLSDRSNIALTMQNVRLQALSDMILLTEGDIEALIRVLKVLRKICTLEGGVSALIHSRETLDCCPLLDLFTAALQKSMYDTEDPALQQLRAVDFATTDLESFLPSSLQSFRHVEAATLSLELVRFCASDEKFGDALETDCELLQEVFVGLASSHWRVAHAASMALSAAIRCPANGNETLCGAFDDEGSEESENPDDEDNLVRYICRFDPSRPNGYRSLVFLADIDDQELFEMSPPSRFPSGFVLLIRWLRFYSVNLALLSALPDLKPSTGDDIAHDTSFDSGQRQPENRVLHEELAANVLELLLYLVVNFHAVIYNSVNGDEEEQEHALVLHALVALCQRRTATEVLLEGSGDTTNDNEIVVAESLLRCRALDLVQLLCSLNLPHTSSVEVFTEPRKMQILLSIVESTSSAAEQRAATQLLQTLALHGSIKELLVGDPRLLSCLGAWLESPELQLLSASILRCLAAKSSTSHTAAGINASLFRFAPSVQEQLAHFLFVGTGAPSPIKTTRENWGSVRQRPRVLPMIRTHEASSIMLRRVHVTMTVQINHNESSETNELPKSVSVKLRVETINYEGEGVREFEHAALLAGTRSKTTFSFLAERTEVLIRCQIVASLAGSKRRWLLDGKQFEYALGEPEALPQTKTFNRDGVTLCFSDILGTSNDMLSPSETGVLSRLLRRGIDTLPPKLAHDLTAIVAEFCKNASIFSDPTVDLPSQVRIVLTASVRCRADGTMDLVCLDALAAWFRSKPTLSFFQTNVLPILRLVQGLRQAPLITGRLPFLQRQQKNDGNGTPTRFGVEMRRHFDFLTALVEWVASVEVPDLTPNCLNVLFMENADVLLYLCSQLYPKHSTYSSFFSLVALATRVNILHCQAFAAPHALRLLLEVFEAGCKTIPEDDEISRGELLCFAGRVILKLARCSASRQSLTARADGLRLYSRIGFEIFAQRSWRVNFPRDAAEHLVLASAFLCDGLMGAIAANSESRSANQLEVLLVGSQMRQNGLTLVETLLLFLGRHTKHDVTEASPDGGGDTFGSFDRLAAATTSALAEKLPSRVKFEQHVLQLLDAWLGPGRAGIQEGVQDSSPVGRRAWIPDQCLSGLQRCLVLTQYDFQSDLNTLRRTYYASIRAGVRKGVIPPQCSVILQRFDRDHLLSRVGQLWQFPSAGGSNKTLYRLQSRGRLSESDVAPDSRRISTTQDSLPAEDVVLETELRELVSFAEEHVEVVAALKANRKKAVTAALRTATNNARVLTACHAMASIILDFYIDTTARGLRRAGQKDQHDRTTTSSRRFLIQRLSTRKLGDLRNAEFTAFYEWLLLLEEMAGLLCCGLHELDAKYYSELSRQCRVLILELPAFLRKMERTYAHSRPQSVLLFLSNLHSLLKRVTNRNELRVVAANGFGVVEQAKVIRERLQKLDAPVSAALGALLESPEAMESLTRALTAMEYMWRRIMGTEDLEEFMERMKETRSLMGRIKDKLRRIWSVTRHPMRAMRALLVKWWMLIWSRRAAQEVRQTSNGPGSPYRLRSEEDGTARSGNTNTTFQDEGQSQREGTQWGEGLTQHLSPFPFCSLELLLDHLGLESIPAKRMKQLLHCSALKDPHSGENPAVELLNNAFELDDTGVEKLDIEELAEFFHDVQGTSESDELVSKLGLLAQEGDMSFTRLPLVVRGKCKVNLWRLLVRPVQRIRLLHLYQQVQRFVRGDSIKRQLVLEGYHRMKRQRSSLQTLSPWRDSPHGQSDRALELTPKSQAGPEPSPPRFSIFRLPFRQRIVAGSIMEGDTAATGIVGVGASALASKVALTKAVLAVCDGISSNNPLSEKAAVARLRRDNEAKKQQRRNRRRWWQAKLGRAAAYREDNSRSIVETVFITIRILAARLVLLIAFWRRENLLEDMHDPMLASAFDNPHERDEFYLLHHARKALMEILRVWMTSSGTLGLRIWQQQRYFIVGTALSVLITQWLPFHIEFEADTDAGEASVASKRNVFMTQIVYGYGISVFVLAVISIVLIARNRFVLLAQSRLRLRPVSRYYQNVMAMAAIVVEMVQLNSLAFDSSIEWSESEQLPIFVQWLGRLGFTQFGVSQVSELQALGILVLLVAWFMLLKCANGFQETSALLDRLLTKDIPAFVHGFLYMGTISTFFSFLACVDCSGPYGQLFHVCLNDPPPAPFLITHQSVECWTTAHRWYALLGFWGITFFVPVGLLAHGMSQVLFQRETLDIKYAPVLLLVSQLVKAAAATAQSFFPFNPMWLAGLGLLGNAVLLGLMMAMRSCSLWYIKYIKCGVYASGCWASLGAIHRLQHAEQSSSRSLNLIYFGWTSIVAMTASAMLLRVWRHAGMKQLEDQKRFAAQRRLLSAGNQAATPANELNDVERKFLRAAKRQVSNEAVRAAFAENARRLDVNAPPSMLKTFVDLARETRVDAPANAVLIQNARMLARQLHGHDGLRRRR